MVSQQTTITYNYTGSKVTEDISEITDIVIQKLSGGGGAGGASEDNNVKGGNGGLIEGASADVSNYDTLELWVAGGNETSVDNSSPGWGRSSGGAGASGAGGGGGSSEIWADSESVFIAAADGGGGASCRSEYSLGGGGGGGRGGQGGSAYFNEYRYDDFGDDGDGFGSGGNGGRVNNGSYVEDQMYVQDGFDGGQELGIASGGTQTTGGGGEGNSGDYYGAVGDGEITIEFQQNVTPPKNLTKTVTTENEIELDWDVLSVATGYYIYRAESSGSSPSDYTQVADVSSPPYTDAGLEDGEQYYYRVSSYN